MPAMHHNHPEAEERQPITEEASFKYSEAYTPGLIERAKSLDYRRKALGLSDAKWCEGCKYDQTTWSRFRNGKYNGTLELVAAEFERHADALEALRANVNLRRPDSKFVFHPWTAYTLAETALQQAKVNAEIVVEGRCGEKKNVVYVTLAHGWGKDEIAGQLQRTYGGNRIIARHGWNRSDYAAMCSIAKQLGIKADRKSERFNSAAEAEEAILEHLKVSPRPLYFLEVEMTGEALQNLWKEISNETRCVVCIFCLPEFFDRHVRKLGVYGEQLRARAEMIVSVKNIDDAWVAKLLQDRFGAFAGLDKIARQLARSASEIGGLRCVQDVLATLSCQSITKPTLSDAMDHVAMWRKIRRLTPHAALKAA